MDRGRNPKVVRTWMAGKTRKPPTPQITPHKPEAAPHKPETHNKT